MFKNIYLPLGAALAMVASGAAYALPQVIDFDLNQSEGTSTDNAAIDMNTPFIIAGLVEVTMGFDTDNDGIADTAARFEKSGDSDPVNGFFNSEVGAADTASPGFVQQLGDTFMRSNSGGANPGTLIVNYNLLRPGEIRQASGEIWDLDSVGAATEVWEIKAFDEFDNLMGTIETPPSIAPGQFGTLDGEPFFFEFVDLPADLAKITIEFIGTKTSQIGLAFDNFRPAGDLTPLPAPSTLLLALVGLFGVRRMRRSTAI